MRKTQRLHSITISPALDGRVLALELVRKGIVSPVRFAISDRHRAPPLSHTSSPSLTGLWTSRSKTEGDFVRG